MEIRRRSGTASRSRPTTTDFNVERKMDDIEKIAFRQGLLKSCFGRPYQDLCVEATRLAEAKKLWIFDAERIYGGWAEASGLVNKNEKSRAQVTKLRTFIRYGRILGASFVEDWRKGSPKLTFEQLLTELRRSLRAYRRARSLVRPASRARRANS
jgi:hypothetical protein